MVTGFVMKISFIKVSPKLLLPLFVIPGSMIEATTTPYVFKRLVFHSRP
jgi:hypothetical protein